MQQLKVATILPKAPTPHPPPPPRGPSRSKFNFQNMVMLHIKGNHECSNMVSNTVRGKINKKHIKRDFYRRPVPNPLGGLEGWGQKIEIQLSDHGHVEDQIEKESPMQQRGSEFVCKPPPTPPLGSKVKIQFLQNMVISN